MDLRFTINIRNRRPDGRSLASLCANIILCGALLAGPGAAWALPIVHADTELVHGQLFGPRIRDGIDSQDGPQFARAQSRWSEVTDFSEVLTQASASAVFGSLHAFADTSYVDGLHLYGDTLFVAGARASWSDTLTIKSDRFAGQRARALWNVFVGGNIVPGKQGDGSWALFLTAGSSSFTRHGQIATAPINEDTIQILSSGEGDSPDLITYPYYEFTIGDPFTMSAVLVATCSSRSQFFPGSECTARFMRSAHWGGIGEVQLLDGTVVSGFTVSSESGTDWTKSFIPTTEPSGVVLAAIALSLVPCAGYIRKR